MVGQAISHYKIPDKLGEGGMGVVYRAEDTNLKRPVALKFLASHLRDNEETKSRFRREAEAAAVLTHPNIAVIYDINESDGHSFIAMELVEGLNSPAPFLTTIPSRLSSVWASLFRSKASSNSTKMCSQSSSSSNCRWKCCQSASDCLLRRLGAVGVVIEA